MPFKIVVVEDEQLVADDLRETLEMIGYSVPALAATGEDAIRIAASLHPDLVLMDIRLAGAIDGIEASNHIQSQFQIPVVYLTANADRVTLDRVKSSNPFGYIMKPFNEAILATTIEIAISRHRAETQIHKALTTAESTRQKTELQMQLKSEYFSMASHELRNPLATIQFATDYLQRFGDHLSGDKKQKYLEQIREATDSLNFLLEDVLTLERVGSGHLHFDPTFVDVATTCQEILDALQFSAGSQYKLTFLFKGTNRTAFVDAKLLWHLLNNLLTNAVKYSPDGGKICLTFSSDGDILCFELQDEGIGIPAESLEQLFQPFHRASNVGSIPGTGLGMAIVKQCVELHGGNIFVESAIGQGTKVTVKLPTILAPHHHFQPSQT